MAKYYIKWKVDHSKLPADPEKRMNHWMTILSWFRADLEAGLLTDWGMDLNWNGGYFLSELDENQLNAVLLKFHDYITSEVTPVLNAEQFKENLKYLMK